jgi:hypothetical protein
MNYSMNRLLVLFAVVLMVASVAAVAVPFTAAAMGGAPGPNPKDCRDGVDNDGDGLADMDDPGCRNKGDKSELNPEIECDDGLDNDGDGDIDSMDKGCESPTDDEEFTEDLEICFMHIEKVALSAAMDTKTVSWTPAHTCLGDIDGCHLERVSVERRYITTGAGAGEGFVRLEVPGASGTDYYISYANDVEKHPDYEANLNIVPKAMVCDDIIGEVPGSAEAGACNFGSDGPTSETYNITLHAGKNVITDVFAIEYAWCWPAK